MRKQLMTAILGAALIAAMAVGCGGGSDSSSTAATGGGGSSTSPSDTVNGYSLSKAEFTKQGDALCVKNNTVLAKEAENFHPSGGGSADEVGEELVTEVYGPGIGRQAELISSLTPPKGGEEEVEAIVTAIEEGAQKLQEEPNAFGKGAFGKASELARAYGFLVCGGE